MEDLPVDDAPLAAEMQHEPEANDDPQDPLDPSIDEETDAIEAPVADPTADMDDMNDQGAATHHNEDDIDNPPPADADADDDSDILSEVDEAQFEDFDPNAIAITEKPGIIDAEGVALLGKHKRKRQDGEIVKKKKKKRVHRPEQPESREPVEEIPLTAEEQAQRDFDAKLDAALAKPKQNRRRAGIDLEAHADEEIADMRTRMAKAAELDSNSNKAGKPAIAKLAMLPQVLRLLNRNTLQSSMVDPEMNLLESVRFFLEPLDDGSMPAYNIQNELFGMLAKLPINFEAIKASGLGKVVYFYTRTKRVQPSTKRQAEKLVGEWTRPILRRNDDYKKRQLREAHYDPVQAAAAAANGSQSQYARLHGSQARSHKRRPIDPTAAPESNRVSRPYNSAVESYTIVPRSDLSRSQPNVRRIGTGGGEDLIRRFKTQGKSRR